MLKTALVFSNASAMVTKLYCSALQLLVMFYAVVAITMVCTAHNATATYLDNSRARAKDAAYLHRVHSTTLPLGNVVRRTIGVLGLIIMSLHLQRLYSWKENICILRIWCVTSAAEQFRREKSNSVPCNTVPTTASMVRRKWPTTHCSRSSAGVCLSW